MCSSDLDGGEEAADGGADAGGHQDGVEVHIGGLEDGRIDEDDVRHGDERGDTGKDLRLDVGVVFLELEQAIQHG